MSQHSGCGPCVMPLGWGIMPTPTVLPRLPSPAMEKDHLVVSSLLWKNGSFIAPGSVSIGRGTSIRTTAD
jgi:hypothetical protein